MFTHSSNTAEYRRSRNKEVVVHTLPSPKKESSSLHSTVLTRFSKPEFALEFEKKTLQNLVVQVFTLLLTPFECKLTNHFKTNRSLKIDQNIEKMPFCLENDQNDDFIEYSNDQYS